MDIEVRRDDFRVARVVEGEKPDPLPDGHASARIDLFALTANNVTYAVAGDMMQYWQFFPASEESFGRVPVWGFATIERSAADGVSAGTRFYGYWPMSEWFVLEPTKISESGFVDGAAHRAALPPVYNRYQTAPGRDVADQREEALLSVIRPLFATAFVLDQWLADEDFFGARSVIVTSASSKTSLASAHQLRRHRRAEVVGVTSARHRDFVASTGAFDRSVTYDDLPEALGDEPAVYVDMAGNADVTATVHRHLGERLRRSVMVGLTHRQMGTGISELPGPPPELFFAPTHWDRLTQEWGTEEFARRVAQAQAAFIAGPAQSLDIVGAEGADDVIGIWQRLVDGEIEPSQAVVARL